MSLKKIAMEIAGILAENAKLKQYPIGHFDIYEDSHFEQAGADQSVLFHHPLHADLKSAYQPGKAFPVLIQPQPPMIRSRPPRYLIIG